MLNKQFKYTLTMLFIICLFNGCSEKDPDRYYNSKDDYSIKFPKDWETKKGLMGTSVVSLRPQGNSVGEFRVNVSIVVKELPGPIALDEFFKQIETLYGKVLKDYQENEKGNTSINEADAKWLICSYRTETQNLKCIAYYVIHEKRGYIINCEATPDKFSRYKNVFEEIAQSFEFE